MKKQTIFISLCGGLASLALVTLPVGAQTANPPLQVYTNGTGVPVRTGLQTANTQGASQTLSTDRVANLKARADTEITRRITSLTNLISRIGTMKRLTADQKTTFTTQIQTEIANLTNLKTKIDADTDLPTLKTDVQSIVFSYRVYLLFMPQIEIMAAADRMETTIANIQTIATKLQTRIQMAGANGKDVTSLQASLTDMQAKLTDAQTQAENAITTVLPLTPAGYPGNKTTLLSGRTMLQSGRKDIQTAIQDAKTIIQGLRTTTGDAMMKTSAIPAGSSLTVSPIPVSPTL